MVWLFCFVFFLVYFEKETGILQGQILPWYLSFSSDGQQVIVDDDRSFPALPAGLFEQLRRCLPAQTGEPGERRLTGGLGQVPRSRQALRQPHHQTEVSQVYREIFQICTFLCILLYVLLLYQTGIPPALETKSLFNVKVLNKHPQSHAGFVNVLNS